MTTEYLYKHLQLKRAYYSSFNPIADTPLENIPPGSPVREHRLYEASFLLRDYGFQYGRTTLQSRWSPAIRCRSQNMHGQVIIYVDHPVEINQAEKQTLLRIPGIGPKIANSIVEYRLKHRLFQPEELSQFGVNLKRAAPFILVNGKYLAYQTSFL